MNGATLPCDALTSNGGLVFLALSVYLFVCFVVVVVVVVVFCLF